VGLHDGGNGCVRREAEAMTEIVSTIPRQPTAITISYTANASIASLETLAMTAPFD